MCLTEPHPGPKPMPWDLPIMYLAGGQAEADGGPGDLYSSM